MYIRIQKQIVLIILCIFIGIACADFTEVVGGKTKSSAALSSPKRKKFHIVKQDETLEQIADAYHVSVMALISVNELDDSTELAVGQKIYMLDEIMLEKEEKEPKKAAGVIAMKKEKSKQAEKPKKKKEVTTQEIKVEKKEESPHFIWPVDGRMTSGFGVRRKRDHDGIDIVSPSGTPVVASKDGNVLYKGRLSSYGNLIIVKHRDNYFTAYAHLSEILVAKDQKVKQGQLIGKVGRTGRASTPHLHFEIRHKTMAVNPLQFLPP